jgi:AmiR/NasT family two-component response regulator
MNSIPKTLELNTTDRCGVGHRGLLPDLLIILTTHILNGRLIRDLNAATEQRAPLVILTGFDTLEAVVNASSQGAMGTTGAVLIKTAMINAIQALRIRATKRF